MPNTIDRDQRSPKFKSLLAASTQVYRLCATISRVQLLLAVAAALLGPLLTWLNPAWKGWGALFAITILLTDWLFLAPWQERNRLLGTKIQECFDVGLFHLPWNALKCGKEPDPTEISKLVLQYQNYDPTYLLIDNEWYPTNLEPIRLPFARLICQWSNLRWDGYLRRRYAFILLSGMLAYLVLGLAWGLANKWSLETYVLALLVPGLPVARLLGENCRKQFEWSYDANRMFECIDEYWNYLVQATEIDNARLEGESRRIQDEIYERRKSTFRVPDLLHRILRRWLQAGMTFDAERAIKQVMDNPRIHP
jgi:hypothetical protein